MAANMLEPSYVASFVKEALSAANTEVAAVVGARQGGIGSRTYGLAAPRMREGC